jgi:cell division protease FtsH
MFVGVGASRVRDLFDQGKAHAPCIIFVDELDAVGRHRGAGLGGGHDEREQTLNALLVEMDGFEANEGVILLAATNRPDVLDPALLRPGRFDRQVVVDAPDVKGREGILRVHAKKLPLAEDVDLGVIAKGTPGLSGADLENICNESALLAAREDANRVTMDHFERARDKIMLGTERKSMVLTENERKLTAYHEAGHAVLGLRIPGLDPVHKITIVPRGRALGITASLPEEDRHTYTKEWLEGQLAMLFGGRVAEEMIFGIERITTGAGNDIDRATAMARRMVTQFGMSEVIGLMAVGDVEHEDFLGRELGHRRDVSEHTAQQVDREVKRILDEAHERARALLEKEEALLERIATALLERETLDRAEIDLLSEGKPLPPLEKLIIPGAPADPTPLAAGAPEVREAVPVEAPETEAERPSPLAHALDRPGEDSTEASAEGEDAFPREEDVPPESEQQVGEEGEDRDGQEELQLGGPGQDRRS